MKRRLTKLVTGVGALILLNCPALAAVEQKGDADDALESYSSLHVEYPLAKPRLSSDGRLVVDTGPGYAAAKDPEKQQWVTSACQNWVKSVNEAKAGEKSVIVMGLHGGTFWNCTDAGAVLLEDWDDVGTPYTGQPQVGNLYLSIAGQASFGGTSSYGINVAEGVILLDHKLDLAFTTSLINTNTTLSIGLLGRYRHPLSAKVSINGGLQPTFSMSLLSTPNATTGINDLSVSTTFALAFLAGVSVFVPSGSIDLTASLATNGAYSLLAGHTFFFNVR